MNVQLIIRIQRESVQNNIEYHTMNATTDTLVDYISDELSCIMNQYCKLGIYYAYSNEVVYLDERHTLLYYGINKNQPAEVIAFLYPMYIPIFRRITSTSPIIMIGKCKHTRITSKPFNPQRRIDHKRRLLYIKQSRFGSAFQECALRIERFLMNKEDDFYYLY
jgi:hypothetical protein